MQGFKGSFLRYMMPFLTDFKLKYCPSCKPKLTEEKLNYTAFGILQPEEKNSFN